MAKIDLLSPQWCELIFKDRNKAFGAYELRTKSPRRHLWAVIIVIILTILIVTIPYLIKTIVPKKAEQVTQVTELSDIKLPPKKEEVKPKFVPPPPEQAPPPPKVKAAMKFTPPVIKKDEEVKNDKELKSQEKLQESKADISSMNIKGSTDRDAVRMDDIKKEVVTTPPPAPKVVKPFNYVEQMPEFPGGDDALQKYIASHIKYPQNAADMGIQGRVVVRLVVKENGAVGEVSVVRKLDPECDREAVRVIKSLPKFIPGRQNGTAVPVWYTLTVTFRLQ